MDEIIIPCKPSSKTWEVELIKDDDQVWTNSDHFPKTNRNVQWVKYTKILFAKQRHEFNYTFNPTEGYRIKLDTITDGGMFTCLIKDDSDFSQNVIDFVVYVNCKFCDEFHVIF